MTTTIKSVFLYTWGTFITLFFILFRCIEISVAFTDLNEISGCGKYMSIGSWLIVSSIFGTIGYAFYFLQLYEVEKLISCLGENLPHNCSHNNRLLEKYLSRYKKITVTLFIFLIVQFIWMMVGFVTRYDNCKNIEPRRIATIGEIGVLVDFFQFLLMTVFMFYFDHVVSLIIKHNQLIGIV